MPRPAPSAVRHDVNPGGEYAYIDDPNVFPFSAVLTFNHGPIPAATQARVYLSVGDGANAQDDLARQYARITEYLTANNLAISALYIDARRIRWGQSRPALEELIADVQPGETAVVWRLDRLGRDMSKTIPMVEYLIADGRSLADVSTGQVYREDDLHMRMLFLAVQMFASEAETQSLRVRDALRANRRRENPAA